MARKIPFSWAASHYDKFMWFKETEWSSITKALSKPKISKESFNEYLALDREQQLAKKSQYGYYICGQFEENLRHNATFQRRATVTLDIDIPGPRFKQRLAAAFSGLELFWHTSRKSSPSLPRIRVHIPLTQDITTASDYEALTRLMASHYDIEAIDRISYVPAQMMFFPSVCSDGVFETGHQRGAWLDPVDALFTGYIDHTDRREWPRTAGEVPPETRVEKADSPLTKPGIIGAFCRAYGVTRTLEEIIPGVYEPTQMEGRWRYHAAEGGGGAIVYDDDTALYSHHTNHDPTGGRSTNAFDLLRVHKFGLSDKDVPDGTPPTRMPSFVEATAYAMTLPEVVQELDCVSVFEAEPAHEAERPSTADAKRQAEKRPARLAADLPGRAVARSAAMTLGDDLAEDPEAPPAVAPAAVHDDLGGASDAPVGLAVSRARLRSLIDDCGSEDQLMDRAIPAIAGGGLPAAVEHAMLSVFVDRYRELTGRGMAITAVKKDVAAVREKLGLNKKGKRTIGEADEVSNVERDDNGIPLNTVANMVVWLHEGQSGYAIARDWFLVDELIAPWGTDEWRPIAKRDYIKLRIAMERSGFTVFGGGNDLIRMAVQEAASTNEFDSAGRWLADQLWDGTPRVERFFVDRFGVKDSRYARAVGRYWWSALAGRVAQPGCKADMMPILYGRQGALKSSSVRAMAPAREHFREFAYKANDGDQGRMLVGRLVAEWNELKGMSNADEDGIKTFLARQEDAWRPLWEEKPIELPRRVMFCGTTDKKEFLSDIAGNRRFLPMTVGDEIDIDAIHADVTQLYAEGHEMFVRLADKRHPEGNVDYEEAELLAKKVHGEHTLADEWDGPIERWLATTLHSGAFTDNEFDDTPTNGDGVVQIVDLLQEVTGMPMHQVNRASEMRVARILKRLGYERFDGSAEGDRLKGWRKTKAP